MSIYLRVDNIFAEIFCNNEKVQCFDFCGEEFKLAICSNKILKIHSITFLTDLFSWNVKLEYTLDTKYPIEYCVFHKTISLYLFVISKVGEIDIISIKDYSRKRIDLALESKGMIACVTIIEMHKKSYLLVGLTSGIILVALIEKQEVIQFVGDFSGLWKIMEMNKENHYIVLQYKCISLIKLEENRNAKKLYFHETKDNITCASLGNSNKNIIYSIYENSIINILSLIDFTIIRRIETYIDFCIYLIDLDNDILSIYGYNYLIEYHLDNTTNQDNYKMIYDEEKIYKPIQVKNKEKSKMASVCIILNKCIKAKNKKGSKSIIGSIDSKKKI